MRDLFRHYQSRAFAVQLPYDYGTTTASVPATGWLFSLWARQEKRVCDFLEGEEALGYYQLTRGPVLEAHYTCVEP